MQFEAAAWGKRDMKHYGMVFCVFVALFFVSFYAWGMGERPKSGSVQCTKTGIYLKMRELVFYIPPYLTKELFVLNEKRQGLEGLSCYKEGISAREVKSFSFFASEYFSDFYVRGKRDASGLFMAVWLTAYLGESELEEGFERFQKKYSVDVTNLSTEGGFYVYLDEKLRRKIFLSKEEELVTPSGNPVVFVCEETGWKECSTNFHRNGILFGIKKINVNHIPVWDWPRFYRQFEGLVDRLIIENETEIPSLQVQGENK